MSETNDTLTDLSASLVAYGRKKGADEVEVAVNEEDEFRVVIRNGEVETLTEAVSRDLGLRVFVDGKMATATSSDLAKATLARLVDNAISRARLGGKDAAAGLPALEKVTADVASLEIFDPAIAELAPAAKIAYARKAEAAGLKQQGVNTSLGARFVTSDSSLVLVNSRGFSGSFRSTAAFAVAGFQAGEGDNLFEDSWFEGGTTLAKLPEPALLATTAASRVTRLRGARKVATQNVPVVMEPPVTASLILGLLAQCVAGMSVSRRQSYLADMLGTKVASTLVTVVDDGLLPGGLGTAPFDSEGVPQRHTRVIEKGVLKSYLLDTYYGRKLKMASTGNADGATNFYLAAGTSKPDEIVKSVEKGLLLTGTIGLGADPTTGDISMGAFGLWIEGGEPVFPVAEVTISANLADVLQGIEMVGNDLRFLDSTNGPTIKVGEMTIGGTAPKA